MSELCSWHTIRFGFPTNAIYSLQPPHSPQADCPSGFGSDTSHHQSQVYWERNAVPMLLGMRHSNKNMRPCQSSDGQSPDPHRGGQCSSPGQVVWDLWRTKRHWGMFSPSTSVSLANSHSTDCSTFIFIRGWYNRPVSGRRIKWVQSHPTRRN
jgi:hypothetical protein